MAGPRLRARFRRFAAPAAAAMLVATLGSCTPAPKPPDQQTPPSWIFADLLDFSQTMREEGAPAVLVQAKNNGAEWTHAEGVRTLDGGQPVQLTDPIHMGGLTTSMIAVSVLKLAEEGRIALDGQVDRYFPDFSRILTPPEPITVRRLLNQESGIPDYGEVLWTSGPLRQVFNSPLTLRDRLALAARLPWKYKLAQPFEPSGSNFVALALIIEQLRGRPFAEVLRSDIIEPLGLTDTFMTNEGRPKEELLHGYITVEDKQFDVAYPRVYIDAPGGMVSTVRDANTYYSALLQGKLLKQSTLSQMKEAVYSNFKLGLARWNDTCTNDFYYGNIGDVQGYGMVSMTSADGKRQVTMAMTYPPSPFVAFLHPLVPEMADLAEQLLNLWC
jgi:D-alanyl-D-alanine carboxypeptidase